MSVFLLFLSFQVPTSLRFFSDDSTRHDTSCVIILCYYNKYILNECFLISSASLLCLFFFSKFSPTIYHILLNSFWWVALDWKQKCHIACAMLGSGDNLGISLACVGCKGLERKNKLPLILINLVEWYMSFNFIVSSVGNFVFSMVKNYKLHEC